MTNVPRFAIPRSALNTPYRWAISPCGQKSEQVPLTHGPDLVSGRGVDAHGEYLHLVVDEVVEVVADRAEFALAGPGERERVEDQQDISLPAVLGQPNLLVVLVLEDEVRGLDANFDRHGNLQRSI